MVKAQFKNQMSYFFQEALSDLKTAKSRVAVCVATIGFALFIFGLFLLIAENVVHQVNHWERTVNMEAYLADEVTLAQTKKIKAEFTRNPKIEHVRYISKKEAFEKFSAAGYGTFLEGLSGNPLPASFQIRVKKEFRNLAGINGITAQIMEIPGIEDVSSAVDLVENLSLVGRFLTIFGFFAGTLIFIASIFIIANTIKLALFSRIEAINIMRMVGATHRFIMAPYLIEGMVQGLIGAFISLVLLFAALQVFIMQLHTEEFLMLGVGQVSFLSPLALIEIVVIGLFIGLLGSYVSVTQFLKHGKSRQ